MAIAFVGGQYNRDSNGPNISVDLSSLDSGTIAAGDVAVLTMMKDQDDGSAHSQDAGDTFTLLHFDESTLGRDRSSSMWWRVLDGTETTVTFSDTGDTSEEHSLLVTVWRGVDNSTPFDVAWNAGNHYTEGQNNYNGTPDPITTATDGAMVVISQCVTHDDITTAGAPTGYTIGVDGTGTSLDNAQQIHVYKLIASAGTETPGAFTHTVNSTVSEANFRTVALRPAPDGPTISDIETDEDIRDGDTAVTLTGTQFEAAQGTGKVELWSDDTGTAKQAQTVTSWADTSIDITVVLGSLTPGDLFVAVTNDSAEEQGTPTPVFVRRKVAVVLSASANITAGGETISSILTGGSGTGGRAWDDENAGADTIDLGDDGDEELVWSIEGNTNAVGNTYTFRIVYADDSALDTYTVTPSIAFVAGGATTHDVDAPTLTAALTTPAAVVTVTRRLTATTLTAALTTPAATVRVTRRLTAPLLAAPLGVPAATVATTTSHAVTAPTLTAALATPAATVTVTRRLTATLLEQVTAHPAATVTVTRRLTATTLTAALTTPAATVTVTRRLTAPLLGQATAHPAATVTVTRNLTAPLLEQAFATPAATVSTSGSTTLTAPTLTAALTTPAATVTVTRKLSAPTLTAPFAVPAATVSTTVTVSAPTLTAALTTPAATVTVTRRLTATTLTAALTTPAAAVTVTRNLTATTVTAALATPAATVTLTAHLAAPTLTAPLVVPAATVTLTVRLTAPTLTSAAATVAGASISVAVTPTNLFALTAVLTARATAGTGRHQATADTGNATATDATETTAAGDTGQAAAMAVTTPV